MCGLVGYAGPPLAYHGRIDAAAAQAARRGPHSWGWAWWDGTGWRTARGSGPLPALPDAATGAVAIVGHSRLATCGSTPGDTPPVRESQPFTAGRYLVAHNGTVADPAALAGRPVVVDSEAILAAMERLSIDDITARMGPAPSALIVATADRVVLVRKPGDSLAAHPLYLLESDGARYACSRPFHPSCHLAAEGITVL